MKVTATEKPEEFVPVDITFKPKVRGWLAKHESGNVFFVSNVLYALDGEMIYPGHVTDMTDDMISWPEGEKFMVYELEVDSIAPPLEGYAEINRLRGLLSDTDNNLSSALYHLKQSNLDDEGKHSLGSIENALAKTKERCSPLEGTNNHWQEQCSKWMVERNELMLKVGELKTKVKKLEWDNADYARANKALGQLLDKADTVIKELKGGNWEEMCGD